MESFTTSAGPRCRTRASWSRRRSLRWRGCFFFSSRRRHTRLQGDWSSDVCSSDLADGAVHLRHAAQTVGILHAWIAVEMGLPDFALAQKLAKMFRHRQLARMRRSEERRVGERV